MNKALLLTAYNRPQYLRETMESWQKVRGFKDWPLHVMIEPSDKEDEILAVLEDVDHPQKLILINPIKYGVLHAPWVGFERLFRHYDFVVRIEDDLVVSDDILEYFDWASEKYADSSLVGSIHGYSEAEGESHEYELRYKFDPWIWGTWKDRWEELIGPTWDHNYSTYNGYPLNESGWDWNLDTRIYPAHSLKGVFPVQSRVHNIGFEGTHATPELYTTSKSFVTHRNSGQYVKVR